MPERLGILCQRPVQHRMFHRAASRTESLRRLMHGHIPQPEGKRHVIVTPVHGAPRRMSLDHRLQRKLLIKAADALLIGRHHQIRKMTAGHDPSALPRGHRTRQMSAVFIGDQCRVCKMIHQFRPAKAPKRIQVPAHDPNRIKAHIPELRLPIFIKRQLPHNPLWAHPVRIGSAHIVRLPTS